MKKSNICTVLYTAILVILIIQYLVFPTALNQFNPVLGYKNYKEYTYNETPSALTAKDITKIDSKVIVGHAPGACHRKNGKYRFDKEILDKDIKFLRDKYYVSTIIDLRNKQFEGSKYKQEKVVAEEYGIKYINIQMDASTCPTEEQLYKFLKAIEDSKGRVYIHCHAGRDRTGIMSSCYLAKKYKLSKEEVFKRVFDKRKVERLKYMTNKEEIENFSNILKNLKTQK